MMGTLSVHYNIDAFHQSLRLTLTSRTEIRMFVLCIIDVLRALVVTLKDSLNDKSMVSGKVEID